MAEVKTVVEKTETKVEKKDADKVEVKTTKEGFPIGVDGKNPVTLDNPDPAAIVRKAEDRV